MKTDPKSNVRSLKTAKERKLLEEMLSLLDNLNTACGIVYETTRESHELFTKFTEMVCPDESRLGTRLHIIMHHQRKLITSLLVCHNEITQEQHKLQNDFEARTGERL